MHGLICVSYLYYVFLIQCVNGNPPTIRQTQNGPVEGLLLTSVLDQDYYAFKGVPFAEPPITGRDPHTGQQVDRRFKVQ